MSKPKPTAKSTIYGPLPVIIPSGKKLFPEFVGAGVNPNWASPYTQIYANTSEIFIESSRSLLMIFIVWL